jgi:hypothetical protein
MPHCRARAGATRTIADRLRLPGPGSSRPWPALGLVSAAALVASVVAVTGPVATVGADGGDAASEFTACMRSHGLEDFPNARVTDAGRLLRRGAA